MSEETTVKKALKNNQAKRSVGNPRKRWLYDENDLKKMGG
jgi:hypothetical protein